MTIFINKYIKLFSFGIIMVLKEALVFSNRGINIDYKHMIYLLIIYLFIGSWTLILDNKNQLKTLIILDVIISILMFADILYLRYYTQFLTLQLFPLLKK
ncbi:hypothetical protein [Clostridium polynesiense]|uniref:hypothetical protein n=1 Tax=Clostridium polynesiense TaxID=1325933 RepID=UPI00058FBC5B|nr:hypothetical protein [Clostridium polynesiense]